MSVVASNLLADAFFARKLIKTINSRKYDQKTEELLYSALEQMNDAVKGKTESQNYSSSSKDSITLLKAYGTAISVVKSLKQFNGDDCVEEYIKLIQKELQTALKTKKITQKSLINTIQYYEQVINFVIDEDISYNAAESSESYWNPIVKN